ncbi:hypothetical protein EDB89DRAFT_1053426 [Lactarius sanguifluus]|nr:hypothetical protein EDB89DRAFT_1053426 [Lactarius sanguifluus]
MNLLSACVDVMSSNAWLNALGAMDLSQRCVQAVWDRDSLLQQIPHFEPEVVPHAQCHTRIRQGRVYVQHPRTYYRSLSAADVDDEDDGDTLVVVPHFAAKKMVNWWVVVGEQSTQQPLSIKRVSKSLKVKLEFTPPKGEHALKLYVICL